MPSLIDIRRRIRAVKSTQQITKAMKMIAASKLRRAQDRVVGARPFAKQMARVLNNLASRVDPSTHPLLATPAPHPDAKTLLIVITADKGLCGGFNTNIIKSASSFITSVTSAADREAEGGPQRDSRAGLLVAPGSSSAEANGESGAPRSGGADRGAERGPQRGSRAGVLAAPGSSNVALGLVGRKGRDFFRRRGFEVRIEEIGIFQKVRFADAQTIARKAIEEFTSRRANSVYVVYNEFKSVMQQRVVIERLLPIPRLDEAAPAERQGPVGAVASGASAAPGSSSAEASGASGAPRSESAFRGAGAPGSKDVEYLYEPGPAQIFEDLLPRHIEIQVYRALLESAAAEHAARMTAMDAATKNSGELIDSLTLYMNKVRQAAITREIIEVVSGAQAL